MTLGELIKKLEALDPATVFEPGWGKSHSWRGAYEQVAFTPLPRSTAGEMLAHARAAAGSTLYGWKGGEYDCTLDTTCNVAAQGEYGGDDDRMSIWWAANVETARLRQSLASEKARADRAEANYRFMVERAADQKLDGYRELGARAAAAETERDAARAEVSALKAEILAAYRERYDCEDDASPADLVRAALAAEQYEHDRFKARGGEIDRLEAQVEALLGALARADDICRLAERDGLPLNPGPLREALASAPPSPAPQRVTCDVHGATPHPQQFNCLDPSPAPQEDNAGKRCALVGCPRTGARWARTAGGLQLWTCDRHAKDIRTTAERNPAPAPQTKDESGACELCGGTGRLPILDLSNIASPVERGSGACPFCAPESGGTGGGRS